MQRGPKPKPDNLRQLENYRREGPARADAPAVIGDKPAAPEWLNDYAMEEWDRLADELYSSGVLTMIDQTMLAAYCMAYARWRRAEEDLEKMGKLDPATHGAMLRTKEGNAIQNPLVGVANVARREMHRIAVEFGLTPSSRTLLGQKGDADDAVAKRYGLT